jgi:metal-dependent amidase/aminoacylase/carboxypeptidase family protein
MPVIDRIKDFQNDLVAIRRDIHAHPEIGFEETRTSAIVADLLETWGITVQRQGEALSRSGVFCLWRRSKLPFRFQSFRLAVLEIWI